MESNKILAIISIIIGLIFIIFPIFSANLISILIGAAVLIFGESFQKIFHQLFQLFQQYLEL